MKILVFGFSFLFGSMLLAHPLLTISGVSLGKTKITDLARRPGAHANLQEGSITYQGLTFWHTGESGIFHTLMLSASNQFQNWPHDWQESGLSPDMNYDQIKSFLESSGFKIIESAGETSYSRRLEGTYLTSDRRAVTLKFDFNSNDQLIHVRAFGMPRP